MNRCLFVPALLLGLAFPSASHATRLDNLLVLHGGYPRALFYRASEWMARNGMPYDQWDATFSRLDGIVGKALDEEIPGTSIHNIEYFTRFKQLHPDQAVILHYNGSARRPMDAGKRYFAGHWLYFNGSRITGDVPAQAADTVIPVQTTALFSLHVGLYKNRGDDVGICLLTPDGRPDWSHAEQAQLLAINEAQGTLTVRRGVYGTVPRHFPAGGSYVAAHAVGGPVGQDEPMSWYYNHATSCPKDQAGRNCNDALAGELAGIFSAGGALAAFDGIVFDAFPEWLRPLASVPGRGIDTDADGQADRGIVDGVNVWRVGFYEFFRTLRQALGNDRLIMSDGSGEQAMYRYTGLINGIDSEGWPLSVDRDMSRWSSGLNLNTFWCQNGRTPLLSYATLKVGGGDETPFDYIMPLAQARMVIAGCQLTDTGFTFYQPAPDEPDGAYGVYDELWRGLDRQANWLGKPLGEAQHVGLRSPDLLNGRGVRFSPGLFEGAGSQFEVIDGGRTMKVSSSSAGATRTNFQLRGLSLPARDLLLNLRVRCDPAQGLPGERARLMSVTSYCPGDLAHPGDWPNTYVGRAGETEASAGGADVRIAYNEAINIRGQTHHGYRVEPPSGRAITWVSWERQVVVPPAPARLHFVTGLEHESDRPAKGVTFQVFVQEGSQSTQLLSAPQVDDFWTLRAADLSPWGGKTVVLRFVSALTRGQIGATIRTCWGDVFVMPGQSGDPIPPAFSTTPFWLLALVDDKSLEVNFYCRDRGPSIADIGFEVEGPEPLYLSALTAHGSPDAVCREFKHGLVLANPSTSPHPFHLGALFPGAHFRRFQGSPEQDPVTNDGRPVGDRVVVPPIDALFLVREGSTASP
jgi:hypothetical protein